MGQDRPAVSDKAARADAESVIARISRAQDKAVRALRQGDRPPDVAAAKDSASDKYPLLSLEALRGVFSLDDTRARFEQLLGEILAILGRWAGVEAPSTSGVDLSAEGTNRLLELAVKGGGTLGEHAELVSSEPDVFAEAVRRALAPFVRACGQEAGCSFEDAADLPGCCPVCGAEPFMAELAKDDGARLLACGLCGTRWRFARLKCPFCGNDKQKELGFLEVDGGAGGEGELVDVKGCRVDVCEVCKRYIKTLDRRKNEDEIDLETTEALTPGLDMAAIEKGYGLPLASD